MIEGFHIYQSRHMFHGDDLIGSYSAADFTLTIFPEHAARREAAIGFFRHRLGINPKVVCEPAPAKGKKVANP